MSLPISLRLFQDSQLTTKEPNIVLSIDGIDTNFGSSTITETLKIGSTGLLIGGGWLIGGTGVVAGQATLISLDGSTTTISHQLEHDKGRGTSVQSMQIELVDINQEATQLITPGLVVDDLLGRKAKIYLALSSTSKFPDDYVILFRGIIDDIVASPASISINIAHPESKKRQIIYPSVEHVLNGAITNSQTTITLDSVDNLLLPVSGPSGAIDYSFLGYVRIDDEIIGYTGISGLQLTGCTRGNFATIPVAHNDQVAVKSFYRLQGTAMDLAQKIMMSGSGYWTQRDVTTFNDIPVVGIVPNTIFFSGINLSNEDGVSVGDFITTTLATNGANNVTLKEILSINVIDEGTYIEVSGVSFVTESTTAAKIQVRSKYDSLPDGLAMGGDEVDVAQHEYLQTLFLSSFQYDFYLKESIENAKEFIETQIYLPASAYSVPRKAKASAQLHIGPLPNANILTLSKENITNPSQLKIRRSIAKNFSNTIIVKFEEDAIEDKFLKGRITQDATSLTRIPVGSKGLVIESKGLRDSLNGSNLANSSSLRKLDRYKYGAESLDGVKTTLGDGFKVEVGDIVILDPTDLKLANTTTGTREKAAAFFEVVNKSLNYKTGEVVLSLTDTNFATNARYALIGISSQIKTGISQTQFVIEKAYYSTWGASEYQKWLRYPLCAVKVRSPDSITRYFQTVIMDASSNTITVRDALGFIPQAGDIMELAQYDFIDTTDQIKLIYGFMSDTVFGDGKSQYQML